MASDDEDTGHRVDQLWRIGQRQIEILGREERIQTSLDRIQARLDEIAQRRDNHDYRVEQFMTSTNKQLEDMLKRPTGGGGLIGESSMLFKVLLMGLLGLVATLALGKAFWPGG